MNFIIKAAYTLLWLPAWENYFVAAAIILDRLL